MRFISSTAANDGPVGFAAVWLPDNNPKRKMTSPVVTRMETTMRMMMIHV